MTAGHEERGSLVIALAVVVVLSSLALAVIVRTVEAVANARVTQDQAAATAAADAGLADASFALDNWIPPAAAPTSGSGTIGAGSYQWTATSTDDFHVDIKSIGTVNGRTHQIDASASRPSAWPWVLATNSSLVIDGPGTVSPAADPAAPAHLGAGGALVLRNGAQGGAEQDLLGPAASCAGCSNPVVEPSTVTFSDAVVPPAPLPCPTTPVTSLSSGVYLCRGTLTLTGPVTVSASAGSPAVIYLEGGPDLATLDLSASTINTGGDPSDLIVHVVGPGVVIPGDGSSATDFTGVIDAPHSSLRSGDGTSPCQLSLTGAMVVGSFSCTAAVGGPRPHLTYDPRVASLPSDNWAVSAYGDAVVGS